MHKKKVNTSTPPCRLTLEEGAELSPECCGECTAGLLSRDVATIESNGSIMNAIRLMTEMDIGCVVVVENNEMVGIFTERDVITRVVPQEIDVRITPVSEVMSEAIYSVEPEEPLNTVFKILSVNRFRHVPVVDEGIPVGMVSVNDVACVLWDIFKNARNMRIFSEHIKKSRKDPSATD